MDVISIVIVGIAIVAVLDVASGARDSDDLFGRAGHFRDRPNIPHAAAIRKVTPNT
jgi:hypothetical protein